ncbi:hypothetical protein BC332_06847 [Capsicum chinense]|nr:hypothetical protein BC332_06847 [Capsicum chinense]
MDMIKVGTAGKQGRNRRTIWDEKGRGEIVQIFVSYSHKTIKSLQFLFCDENENGKLVLSNKYGSHEYKSFCAVTFDYPIAFLTSISGSFQARVKFGSTLSSISFGTNKGSYGPFGTPSARDSKFIFQIGNYPSFGGFHGGTNGCGIGSIGVYIKPITTPMINFKDLSVKAEKEGVQEKKVNIFHEFLNDSVVISFLFCLWLFQLFIAI